MSEFNTKDLGSNRVFSFKFSFLIFNLKMLTFGKNLSKKQSQQFD